MLLDEGYTQTVKEIGAHVRNKEDVQERGKALHLRNLKPVVSA